MVTKLNISYGASPVNSSLKLYTEHVNRRRIANRGPKNFNVKIAIRPNALQGALAIYRNAQGGYTLRNKAGLTSEKDPIAVTLNRYYSQGGRREIAHIYSEKSNVLRSTGNLLAVKTTEGVKGWITAEGMFLSEDEIAKTLYSIDNTIIGSENSLLDIWENLTPQQQAMVADNLRNIDWDAFWEDFYPQNVSSNINTQYAMYNKIVLAFSDVVE